ncbi:unnamed protein product, partial [Amoebophrya sp. A25]
PTITKRAITAGTTSSIGGSAVKTKKPSVAPPSYYLPASIRDVYNEEPNVHLE